MGMKSIVMVVFTVIDKKAGEINFPTVFRIFSEADGVDQVFIGKIGVEKSMMNATQINKIETASGHNKERFRIAFGTLGQIFGEIGNMSDTSAQIKLTDADQLIINASFICHAFGTERYTAFQTDRFLVVFGLNR